MANNFGIEKNKWYIATPGFKVISDTFKTKLEAEEGFKKKFDETRELNWRAEKGSQILASLKDHSPEQQKITWM